MSTDICCDFIIKFPCKLVIWISFQYWKVWWIFSIQKRRDSNMRNEKVLQAFRQLALVGATSTLLPTIHPRTLQEGYIYVNQQIPNIIYNLNLNINFPPKWRWFYFMIFVNLQENYFTLTAIRMDPDVSASNPGKLIITKKQENATLSLNYLMDN